MTTLQELNQPMCRFQLNEEDLTTDPLTLFDQWMKTAIQEHFYQPNAMSLATVDENLRPHVRTLLLKDYSPEGFVFYTHYQSQKGQDLAAHPWAEMLFYWDRLERQVRIGGTVEKISAAESQAYFETRSRDSQIGAAISPQSQIIPDRTWLESACIALDMKHQGQPIPRPEDWGGYRLIPTRFEFWQGRPGRLHDRFRYEREISSSAWTLVRLAP